MTNNHHCKASLIRCIDFRLNAGLASFLEKEMGLRANDYDPLTRAGGVMHLIAGGDESRKADLLVDLEISTRLHEPKTIILTAHGDCGAYGGRKAFASVEVEEKMHERALREAKALINGLYPDKAVELLYADILDDGRVVVKKISG